MEWWPLTAASLRSSLRSFILRISNTHLNAPDHQITRIAAFIEGCTSFFHMTLKSPLKTLFSHTHTQKTMIIKKEIYLISLWSLSPSRLFPCASLQYFCYICMPLCSTFWLLKDQGAQCTSGFSKFKSSMVFMNAPFYFRHLLYTLISLATRRLI